MEFLDWSKVEVLHRITRRYALSVIVPQHLTEKVYRFVCRELPIGLIAELLPVLLRELSQRLIVVAVKLHVIAFDILEEFVSAEDLRNLDELIVVVLPLEKWFFLEYHTGEHAAEGPNIE